MTNWQAIRDEIEKHATFPVRGPEDFILPDIYRIPNISRQRAITILEKLVTSGVLVEWGPVWTKTKRLTTAYRLAEGRTEADIGAVLT